MSVTFYASFTDALALKRCVARFTKQGWTAVTAHDTFDDGEEPQSVWRLQAPNRQPEDRRVFQLAVGTAEGSHYEGCLPTATETRYITERAA